MNLYLIQSSDLKYNNLIIESDEDYSKIKDFNCGYSTVENFFPKINAVVRSNFFCNNCPYKNNEQITICYNQISDILIKRMKVSHLPSDIGKWISYSSKFRYKMYYDIKLKNGDIVYGCYPNGISFSILLSDERNKNVTKSEFKDSEILEICLISEERNDVGIPCNSKYSIDNNYQLFDNFILETC